MLFANTLPYFRKVFLHPNANPTAPIYTGKSLTERVKIVATNGNIAMRLVDERVCVEAPNDATLRQMLLQRELEIMKSQQNSTRLSLLYLVAGVSNLVAATYFGTSSKTNDSALQLLLRVGAGFGLASFGLSGLYYIDSTTIPPAVTKTLTQLKRDPVLDIIEKRDAIYRGGFTEAFKHRTDQDLPTSSLLQQEELSALYEQGIIEQARLAATLTQRTVLTDEEFQNWATTFRNLNYMRSDWIEYAYSPGDSRRIVLLDRASKILSLREDLCAISTPFQKQHQQLQKETSQKLNEINLMEKTCLEPLTKIFAIAKQDAETTRKRELSVPNLSSERIQKIHWTYHESITRAQMTYDQDKEPIAKVYEKQRINLITEQEAKNKALAQDFLHAIKPTLEQSLRAVLFFKQGIDSIV